MKKTHLLHKQRLPVRWDICAILIVSFSFSLPPPLAQAWGTQAHRIVAHIAIAHLSQDARQQLARFTDSRSLVEIANDADLWRETRPETSPWHYVNIPFDASDYDARRDCPTDDCVIAAVIKYQRILADGSQRMEARYEALAFLVHLVADAHQPLHCIDNNDRGGNDTMVSFFGAPTNLHAVWDNELLFRTRWGERAYVRRLMTWVASHNLEALQRGTIVDWVLEAHQLARTYAYNVPANHILRSDYYRANLPIVDSQLAKAGVRLARVVNDAFQDSQCEGKER